MKVRSGFVSNSSSASFIVSGDVSKIHSPSELVNFLFKNPELVDDMKAKILFHSIRQDSYESFFEKCSYEYFDEDDLKYLEDHTLKDLYHLKSKSQFTINIDYNVYDRVSNLMRENNYNVEVSYVS